ncbi:hypothetical protein [Wolbachia endosymbiont (group A) of Anoplius nigerrimus]|nr:hypothetical protein [Wolbachia endosymbiont (group A) of Anoplius nigerrimus]
MASLKFCPQSLGPGSKLSEAQPILRSHSLNSLHSDNSDIKIDSSSQCR